MKNYLIRVGDATSQWVNVVFLFSQNPNESISGRAWANDGTSRVWSVVRPVIDFVVFWEEDHCQLSYEADIQRAERLLEGR